MVFVHARNATVRTGMKLLETAQSRGQAQTFLPEDSAQYGQAQKAMSKSRNKQVICFLGPTLFFMFIRMFIFACTRLFHFFQYQNMMTDTLPHCRHHYFQLGHTKTPINIKKKICEIHFKKFVVNTFKQGCQPRRTLIMMGETICTKFCGNCLQFHTSRDSKNDFCQSSVLR